MNMTKVVSRRISSHLVAVITVAFISLSLVVPESEATISYTQDGILCIEDLKSLRLLEVHEEKCRIACRRVKDVIAGKGEGCAQTARDLHALLSQFSGPSLPEADSNVIIHRILDSESEGHRRVEAEKSCLYDLESHWGNREKFCSPAGDAESTAASDPEVINSVYRSFAIKFLTRYQHNKKDPLHPSFCFPTMLSILNNPDATLFGRTNGACPSILTSKWDSNSCSESCWSHIVAASAAAGGGKCCAATFIDDFTSFLYGAGTPPKGNDWGVEVTAGCSKDKMPCTTVQEAFTVCKNAGRAGAADYFPVNCHGDASALQASVGLSVALVALVVSRLATI